VKTNLVSQVVAKEEEVLVTVEVEASVLQEENNAVVTEVEREKEGNNSGQIKAVNHVTA
jgi:hypothetical protein